jgi:hypothetical protein
MWGKLQTFGIGTALKVILLTSVFFFFIYRHNSQSNFFQQMFFSDIDFRCERWYLPAEQILMAESEDVIQGLQRNEIIVRLNITHIRTLTHSHAHILSELEKDESRRRKRRLTRRRR